MFFRGRQPEASVWRRFRTGIDGFMFVRENDFYVAQVEAGAERSVDLFHALAENLPPAVSVAVEDIRSDRSWVGDAVALPDVRDTIARLKQPLSQYGGVELAVYSADDQITLSPHLELFIYGVTDQWLYLLRGKGLEERRTVRPKSWRLTREQFAAAPELGTALEAAVERLALTPG